MPFRSPDELGRLGAAFAEAGESGTASPHAVAAIRLLVLTGARLSEVLTLRWEYLDLERGAIRLPDPKTGAKTLHLNALPSPPSRPCRGSKAIRTSSWTTSLPTSGCAPPVDRT